MIEVYFDLLSLSLFETLSTRKEANKDEKLKSSAGRTPLSPIQTAPFAIPPFPRVHPPAAQRGKPRLARSPLTSTLPLQRSLSFDKEPLGNSLLFYRVVGWKWNAV